MESSSQQIDERSIDPLDYYRIVRGQLEHEDNLITNRLSWLIASQSFLFTAYAILAGNVSQGVISDPRRQLLVLIPGIAGLTCIFIFLAILGGVIAMHNLRKLHRRHSSSAHNQTLPPVQGYHATQFLGLVAPILLPILFTSVWVYLLIRRLF
jgi:hypothetical protein